jgi:hypothetical protein
MLVLTLCRYYEVPATVGGRVTLDGGLTNNLPLHPVHPDTTVRVSPRWDCGEATVKPSRPYPAWFSLFPRCVGVGRGWGRGRGGG